MSGILLTVLAEAPLLALMGYILYLLAEMSGLRFPMLRHPKPLPETPYFRSEDKHDIKFWTDQKAWRDVEEARRKSE